MSYLTTLDRATARRFHQYHSMLLTIIRHGWPWRELATRARKISDAKRGPLNPDGGIDQHRERCIARKRANSPWVNGGR